ncbi:hypothetical protein [Amycolatopsis thermophila]|uniref:Uncharacterized protein YydD (DUF2326 family) n=1 Tax=Amycolatopsis thermophila TaxID=206084 RepID=A0ABU0ERN4_9PSEU|nr:hypothetical protein [Amycolatopsis thermophila]MDQ0377958.1 uncharacterized protein YydD (DUF2326 family) [Amycolatopsis thermophila]
MSGHTAAGYVRIDDVPRLRDALVDIDARLDALEHAVASLASALAERGVITDESTEQKDP